MSMKEMLLELKEKALADLEAAASSQELQDLKVKYLGRKGPMTEILRGMGKVPAEERPKIGEIVNQVKQTLEQCLKDRTEILRAEALKAKIANDKVDITLPGRKPAGGHLHPITLTNIEGPEIDNDYFNFEALNLPKDHPARDMQDTFYITDNFLLRTQTSGVQARTMQSKEPNTPIRMISPGAVYRNDYDATHSPMFHQVEGLVVDKNISLADLKGTLETNLRRQGLQRVQTFRMAGNLRRRRSASQCAGDERLRFQTHERLRLRHGCGTHCHAEIRHRRFTFIL